MNTIFLVTKSVIAKTLRTITWHKIYFSFYLGFNLLEEIWDKKIIF